MDVLENVVNGIDCMVDIGALSFELFGGERAKGLTNAYQTILCPFKGLVLGIGESGQR